MEQYKQSLEQWGSSVHWRDGMHEQDTDWHIQSKLNQEKMTYLNKIQFNYLNLTLF